MRHPSELRRTLIRVLVFFLVFQGYPAMALAGSGRLELSEPARDGLDWLDEQIEGLIDLSIPDLITSVLPATQAAHFGASGSTPPPPPPDLEVPVDSVFGPGSDGAPPFPPGFRGPEELSPSLRKFYGEVGLKAGLDAVSLVPGWNLSSIPEEPADPDPAQVLAPIAGAFSKVWAYDACDAADPWKLYDPADAAASDLTAVDHKIGFWIDANAPVDLPSDGTLPATTTFQLCVGWNLIGFPAGQPRHVRNALQSIEGKYVRVFGYDPTDAVDPWEIYDVAVPEWANDLDAMRPGRGYWVLVTEAATLEIANEGDPPVVDIVSPADLAVITEPTDVVGTVHSTLLESWSLAYRLIGDPEWIEIASRPIPVTGAALARLDTTLLLNGLYEIELTATDFEGRVVSDSIAVSVEENLKLGHFTLTFLDLAVPVSGLDIMISRTYDSRDKEQQDFGVGWTLDIRQGSYHNNRKPGEGWQFQTGFLPCDTILETKSHLTVVRLSENEIYRFTTNLRDGAPTLGGCFARAEFELIDGPVPGATLEILGNDEVFYENGTDQVIDVDTFEPYEPQGVRLVTRDGRTFDLDLTLGVTRLEDLNGNGLTISDAGITHTSGKGIVFERDAVGRIAKIIDPKGDEILYAYDAAGDLISVTDLEGHTARFFYDQNHYLVEIENAAGARPVRNDYDEDGRLVRITDAFGNTFDFTHDVEGRREIVNDRLGHTAVVEYDARGNPVRQTDRLGRVTTRTFDVKGNVLTETNPLGNTTTYTYDANRDLTRIADPLGNAFDFTYDSRGFTQTAVDPRGGVTSITYDAAGNPLSITDPLGRAAQATYDSNGNLLTMADGAGNTFTFEYDSFGNQIRQVDLQGTEHTTSYDVVGRAVSRTSQRTTASGTETLVTSFAYDKLGRRTSVTDTEGATARFVYGPLSNIVEQIDKLGRKTTFTYDILGRRSGAAYIDGTSYGFTYDAEGRMTGTTGRDGRSTFLTYDAEGQLLSTTEADGTSRHTAYDAGGRVTSRTDAAGQVTGYSYDAADRLLEITAALGLTTRYTYDASGNVTSVRGRNGGLTEIEYDAVGRPLHQTLADGSEMTLAYDEMGRQTQRTDGAGGVTNFAYDALGRLISVEDALGQTTGYTWDEQGNMLSHTDANGHTTRFEYDRRGRTTRRILPDDSAESFTYGVAGNLLSRTDFLGRTTTFFYDNRNRLIERVDPDSTSVQITYTEAGRRQSVQDSRGLTTYAYDDRNRLEELTYPDGRSLRYGYDPNGQLSSITAKIGTLERTTSYEFDDLRRLRRVVDPLGGEYLYSYDSNGDRSSLTFPNGVETAYTYDLLHRLSGLETRGPGGDLLFSESYARDGAGNRTQVVENDGTVRGYSYDALHRLVGEAVSDASGPVYENTFSYDGVGNRLQQTKTDSSGTSTIDYTYDTRDRLLSAGLATYSWDANGNLLARTDGGTAVFDWDPLNRLRSVTLPGGETHRQTYDADGRRVASEVTDASGTETVDFLVDPQPPFSQVVAESSGNQSFDAYYLSGEEPLAAIDAAGDRIYSHTDALGSIRLRTDGAGAEVDRFRYSAFGELLDPALPESPLLFAGERYEAALGLADHRARWMDPSTGRFLSMDPFAGALDVPASLHEYGYVANNPVNLVDPTGLSWISSPAGIMTTLVMVTLVANIGITLRAGAGIAAANLFPDGALLSVRGSVNGYGFSGGAGFDFAWTWDSLDPWWSKAGEGGTFPLSRFKTQRGVGWGVGIGGVFNMTTPNDLAGWGYSASWPTSILNLLPKAVYKLILKDKGAHIWAMMLKLNARTKLKAGNVLSFGLSGPASIFQFAKKSNDFGTTISYNSPFRRIPVTEYAEKWLVDPLLDFIDFLQGLALSSADAMVEYWERVSEYITDQLVFPYPCDPGEQC